MTGIMYKEGEWYEYEDVDDRTKQVYLCHEDFKGTRKYIGSFVTTNVVDRNAITIKGKDNERINYFGCDINLD